MAQGELKSSLGLPQHAPYGSEALPVPWVQTPRTDEGMEPAEGGEEKLEPSKSQDVPAFHCWVFTIKTGCGEASQETPGIL